MLLSVTYNFYSDKIITPQARFCWTLSHDISPFAIYRGSNLHDPDLNQMTYQSAAKKMKQCGPTSAELKPDVKGTFHPDLSACANVCMANGSVIHPCTQTAIKINACAFI